MRFMCSCSKRLTKQRRLLTTCVGYAKRLSVARQEDNIRKLRRVAEGEVSEADKDCG